MNGYTQLFLFLLSFFRDIIYFTSLNLTLQRNFNMDNYSIKLNNVSKSFKLDTKMGFSKLLKRATNLKQQKSILAIDEVSFTVPKGEVLSIIGFNGSGKSTLLRIIAGVYKPTSGYVNVNGSLSPLMQLGAGFQLDLDAGENIIMNGMLLGISKPIIEGKVENIIEYAELEKFSNMKLKYYSSGMRSRLAFATAIQINPDILLVDEILAVGDKDFQKKSYESLPSYMQHTTFRRFQIFLTEFCYLIKVKM